jgi:hypothetical protein
MLMLCLPALATMAQEGANAPVEMADAMRQNGKIYVVIAVILTILAGLIAYVVRIDRKLTRLEKESR